MQRKWAVIVGAWHLYGLFLFNQIVFFYAATQGAVSWPDAIQRTLLTTWFWLAATFLILGLVSQVRRREMSLAPALLLHLMLALALAFLNAVVDHARILVTTGTPGEGFGFQFLYQLSENFLLYFVVVLLSTLGHLRAIERARERAAAELEARLARSELQLLRMQLRPHFLFNTFQSVSTLIHSDPEAADRMVGRLSDLLRLSIDHGADDLASVDAELEALTLYLGIQRARYEERLRVTIDVEDDARGSLVPHMILQPLVENAIVHGLPGKRGSLHLDISIRQENGALRLRVSDDGAGADPVRLERQNGVGLLNTKARLQRLYGEEARLEVSTSPGEGFTAVVHVPSLESTLDA